MSELKSFLALCMVVVLAFVLYVFAPTARQAVETGWGTPPQETISKTERIPGRARTDDVPPPVTKTQTISLMPGQAFNGPNRNFRKVEIHSEYPLRIMIGPCHDDYAVQFFCDSEPSDLFVADTRKPPLFLTPKGNLVTITVTSY